MEYTLHEIDTSRDPEIHKVEGVKISNGEVIPSYGMVHYRELEVTLPCPDDALRTILRLTCLSLHFLYVPAAVNGHRNVLFLYTELLSATYVQFYRLLGRNKSQFSSFWRRCRSRSLGWLPVCAIRQQRDQGGVLRGNLILANPTAVHSRGITQNRSSSNLPCRCK